MAITDTAEIVVATANVVAESASLCALPQTPTSMKKEGVPQPWVGWRSPLIRAARALVFAGDGADRPASAGGHHGEESASLPPTPLPQEQTAQPRFVPELVAIADQLEDQLSVPKKFFSLPQTPTLSCISTALRVDSARVLRTIALSLMMMATAANAVPRASAPAKAQWDPDASRNTTARASRNEGVSRETHWGSSGLRGESAAGKRNWDIRDTLTSVIDGASTVGTYDYDAQLQRVKADTQDGHVEYVLDGKYVLQETGARTRRYHFGEGNGLAVTDGSGSRWLLNDAQGSTSTEVGTSTTQRKYDAWGNYRGGTTPTATEPRLGYTGHQYDIETGLTYARARYYDSVNGVFLSQDSVEGSTSDAPSLHRFAYAHDNPLRFTDFSGHDAAVVPQGGLDAEQRKAMSSALQGSLNESELSTIDTEDDDALTDAYEQHVVGDFQGASGRSQTVDFLNSNQESSWQAAKRNVGSASEWLSEAAPVRKWNNFWESAKEGAQETAKGTLYNAVDSPSSTGIGAKFNNALSAAATVPVGMAVEAVKAAAEGELLGGATKLVGKGVGVVAKEARAVATAEKVGVESATAAGSEVKRVVPKSEPAGVQIRRDGEIVGGVKRTTTPKLSPTEPYSRDLYGRTPTKADRRAVGAGPGQVADHDPPLAKRFYEGDPAIGEKPGFQMTAQERAASAADRSRMKVQPKSASDAQGGEMSAYSKEQRKKHGL